MAFVWREYFDLAEFLAKNAGSAVTQEAAYRSAISRAYYAAFCHARNYARDQQGFSPTNTARDHGLVRKHFQKQGNVDIASYLDNLRQWRNLCDYSDVVSSFTSLLVPTFDRAQKVFDSLK